MDRGRTERIRLEDTTQSAVMKLAEGNPGALRVCMDLLMEGGAIDPDAIMGGVSNLLGLDSLGIYGPDIWVLYKDRCGSNLAKMIAVLRAWQLGLVSEGAVRAASHDASKMALPVDDLYVKVKEQLPNFDPKGLGQGS